MGVNIRDVVLAIQWKIPDHLVFPAPLQRIGRAGHNKTLLRVSIVFIKSKHVLPDDIAPVRDSPFRDYRTAIGPHDRAQAAKIISTFYENNFQNKKVKTPTPYHALDPAVLWFINITGCCRRLALACFMSNSFFIGQTVSAYCDNCLYDKWQEVDSVVPVFERHNITVQYCLWYLTTNEYILAAKIQRTMKSAQRQQREKTSMSDQNTCKAALTDFARVKWPHGMDELIFSSALRQRLASVAVQIVSIDDLCKELSPACHLNTSSLRAHTQEIMSILQGIMTSTKSPQEDLLLRAQNNCLPTQQEAIAPQDRTILLTEIEAPNKLCYQCRQRMKCLTNLHLQSN